MYWVLISVFVYLCWVHIAIKRGWDTTHQRLVHSVDMVLGMACVSLYLRAAPIGITLWLLTVPAYLVVVLTVLRWLTNYRPHVEYYKALCYAACVGMIMFTVMVWA